MIWTDKIFHTTGQLYINMLQRILCLTLSRLLNWRCYKFVCIQAITLWFILCRETPYDERLLQRYRKALDTAVKIATVHNVMPIRGRTVIFCSLSEQMKKPCQSAKKGLGKPRTVSCVTDYWLLNNRVLLSRGLSSVYGWVSIWKVILKLCSLSERMKKPCQSAKKGLGKYVQ